MLKKIKLNKFLFKKKYFFLLQEINYFNYSIDSILLINFIQVNSKVKKVLDIGTNNGIITIVLKKLFNKLNIFGIDLNFFSIKLAKHNLCLNNIEDKKNIVFKNIKVQGFSKISKFNNYFDLIVSNPPYFKNNYNILKKNKYKQNAFFDISLPLEDLVKSTSILLKTHGKFIFIYDATLLNEIFNILRKYNFYISKMQFIFTKKNNFAKLILIEAVRKKTTIETLVPIFIYDFKNIKKIYNIFKPIY